MNVPRRPGRKLLVASLGVAAVSYACHATKEPEQVGNLVAPPPEPSAETPPPPEQVGNLMAPLEPVALPTAPDAGTPPVKQRAR